MERKKEEWKRKIEGLDKEMIKWKWTSNRGDKWDGTYEGEVKDNQPHGLGKWKGDNGKMKIEGEWKDGHINGKAVQNWSGYRDEYEAKDGKYNGKLIRYYDDGIRS